MVAETIEKHQLPHLVKFWGVCVVVSGFVFLMKPVYLCSHGGACTDMQFTLDALHSLKSIVLEICY